jgi:flagellar motility protein MotE (MotC chaperone)
MTVRDKQDRPKAAARSPAGRKRLRRGTLLLPAVLACFVGSVAARLASGTGAAIAEEIDALLPAAVVGEAPGNASSGPACVPDPDLAPILARLAEREARLAAAENGLEEKRMALAVAEDRITARLGELKSAEESLAATMSRTATAAEDDLARLTAVYETMKPKEAVKLFDAMVPDFAAGFLARMRPDAAGAILSAMRPDNAYAVSVILAGRNAKVPVPAPPATSSE